MDTQTSQLMQVLDMMKQEQAERQAEKDASFMNTLMQPMSLIIGSGVLTLLLVGGLVAWFLKRGKKNNDVEPVQPVAQVSPADTAPVAAAAASAAIIPDLDDTPELSDDELFNDDELLDDVLSNELEESLDDDLESFADLDDDMLVPEEDFAFEDGNSELGQDELDSLFDDDLLADDSLVPETDEMDGIDLSGDDESSEPQTEETQTEAPEPEATSDVVSDDDIDALLAGNTPESDEPAASADDDDFDVDALLDANAADLGDGENEAGESAQADAVVEEDQMVDPDDILSEFSAATADEDEKPEIDIDDLLEDNQPGQDITSSDGSVDEEMLEKLDREINDQNQELDRLTDNIINEMDQLDQMADMLGDDETAEEEIETQTTPSPQAIQDLDAFSEDLDEIDVEDMEMRMSSPIRFQMN